MTDTLSFAPAAAPAAVFGDGAISAHSVLDVGKAEVIVRPNIFEITFGTAAAWFLLVAFLVFLCLMQRKTISLVGYYLINSKKNFNRQLFQQRTINLAFGVFVFFALVFLVATVWNMYASDITMGICFVISLGLTAVYLFARYFFCLVIQFLTRQRMFAFNLLTANIYSFFAMCFLLIPLFFVQTLVIPPYYESLMWVQIWVAGVFLLYYFVRTFIVFMGERIPLFFWLLYVSAVEILPLAIVYKIIMQT